MFKQFSNLNRSGKMGGGRPELPGVRPFDPQAPKYSGIALFMDEAGSMLDLDELPYNIGNTIVYVLFCQGVPLTSSPMFAITHVGVVLSASPRDATTGESLPVATIQFIPVLKPGQGPVESRPQYATRAWNASVLPPNDWVAQELFLRPAYDYSVSDEPSVQVKSNWSINLPTSATANTGVAMRGVEAPLESQSDVYGIVAYAACAISPRGDYTRPLSTIVNCDDGQGVTLIVADLVSPVAAIQVESVTEHYWLALCKLSGKRSTMWRFAKYGFDGETPLARLANQRPLIMLANDSVRFNP